MSVFDDAGGGPNGSEEVLVELAELFQELSVTDLAMNGRGMNWPIDRSLVFPRSIDRIKPKQGPACATRVPLSYSTGQLRRRCR